MALTIAYFISPHGFGHAARSCAVMADLLAAEPSLRCEIFTQVPRWFFAESLGAQPGSAGPFGYHSVLTDIGMVQRDALHEDLPATIAQLARFLPFAPERVSELAQVVRALGCHAILCDISPLGLAVAQAARLPSLLVENFTWDQIYAAYTGDWPLLQGPAAYLAQLYAEADYRVRAVPSCGGPAAHLTASPIARRSRRTPEAVRFLLGIPQQAPMVLITMGGMEWEHRHLERLAELAPLHFVLPGQDGRHQARPNLHLLPQHGALFHPDLVAASTAVIGKIGYSTLAEVYQAGALYGYVPRPHFPESACLESFAAAEMGGMAVPYRQFADGSWVERVPELLACSPGPDPVTRVNGAAATARFVLERLA